MNERLELESAHSPPLSDRLWGNAAPRDSRLHSW